MGGDPARVVGLVLAAGTGSRFGGGKMRARLDDRPLVAHVLATARKAGVGRLLLVLGGDAATVRGDLLAADPAALDGVLVAVNPAAERGLATSLRLGLAAATAAPAPAGVLVLLGDQPRVRPAVIAALIAAAEGSPPGTRAVAPLYGDDGAPNPVLLLRPGWPLVAGLEGDRGIGPFLTLRPDLVVRVPVAGSNPDVDTPEDLAALSAPGSWAVLEDAHP
jgi:molybdenum cofactor cytidylyltransferase